VSETTRFAPSPNGFLHLGHAFAAITAYECARSSGTEGRFLLRIEDLDQERSRAEYVSATMQDLAWLGLKWEQPVLNQSTRHTAYRTALAMLDSQGLTYPCFCTRREITDITRAAEAPHSADPIESMIYPGTCRGRSPAERNQRMADGQSFAIRLDSARAAQRCGDLTFVEVGQGPVGERGSIRINPQALGDIVLARKDLPAAYHLAVVVDDAFQSVTLVTRGNDLFIATYAQRLLQQLLELPVPQYAHHRLILDQSGRKFSKRDQAVTLKSLRQTGVSAAEVRKRVGLAPINTAVPVPRPA
jgi:glutamyl-Q tRNA(Asp) synthetase